MAVGIVLSTVRRSARTAASGAIVLLVALAGLVAPAPRAEALSSAPNGAIADKALTYVNRWGGAACADAGFSGYTGGRP